MIEGRLDDQVHAEKCRRGWCDRRSEKPEQADARRRDAGPLTRADVQVALGDFRAEHQEHPGYAPLEQVGPKHRSQSPSLQVGRLDVTHQGDPMPGPSESVSQLDILDGGSSIEAGVEAAEVEEDLPTDRATAGPEGVGGAGVVVEGALLVNIVVQEVAELAHQSWRGRMVVVRAEQGGQAGIGVEAPEGLAQGVGVDDDVGVEEEDDRGRGHQGPGIAGRGGARRPVVAEHARARTTRRDRPSHRGSRHRQRPVQIWFGPNHGAPGGSARSRGPRRGRGSPPRAAASGAPDMPDRRGNHP